jgi:ElaB/YqjD/DUF883 family membrane-anchored ribosome-binding protein
MADDPNPAPAAKSRLEQLADTLWNDKGPAGAAYRAKAKELFPDVPLPEEAAEAAVEPVKAELTALQAKFDEMIAERAAEKKAAEDAAVQTNLETAVANARAKFHLTEDGFDKMVARMKETGNYTDAESAAAWVAMQTPAPTAPGPYLGPQALDLFGSKNKNEAFELLHRDPTGAFLDSEFREFLANPDKYVQEAGFA